MVIQRLEICIGMVKLVFDFIVLFIEAVDTVISQNDSTSAERNYRSIVPYIGLFS
ncbi:unnamed protein product [Withania somnifera]